MESNSIFILSTSVEAYKEILKICSIFGHKKTTSLIRNRRSQPNGNQKNVTLAPLLLLLVILSCCRRRSCCCCSGWPVGRAPPYRTAFPWPPLSLAVHLAALGPEPMLPPPLSSNLVSGTAGWTIVVRNTGPAFYFKLDPDPDFAIAMKSLILHNFFGLFFKIVSFFAEKKCFKTYLSRSLQKHCSLHAVSKTL